MLGLTTLSLLRMHLIPTGCWERVVNGILGIQTSFLWGQDNNAQSNICRVNIQRGDPELVFGETESVFGDPESVFGESESVCQRPCQGEWIGIRTR